MCVNNYLFLRKAGKFRVLLIPVLGKKETVAPFRME